MDYKDLNMWAKISFIVLLIGGIDMGLAGLFGVDLLFRIFGALLARLFYIIIGAAAGYLIYYKYFRKQSI